MAIGTRSSTRCDRATCNTSAAATCMHSDTAMTMAIAIGVKVRHYHSLSLLTVDVDWNVNASITFILDVALGPIAVHIQSTGIYISSLLEWSCCG